MKMLRELVERLRNGELTFDEFVDAVAELYVPYRMRGYPETDDEDTPLNAIRESALATAPQIGLLTDDEYEAVMVAIRSRRRQRS